ncbi:sulfotransferase family 2 domain-containing protein [Nocardioides allogilvus]|uniref:sulfotransferase family 2 domain-containing protein n=1 Tax=Nocardioides allogilvus TaxID=2072017 RepID=UPI000D327196|nr:sulfotransferase family 2 domain-containing protein [Nocardioides allogilvus]
MLISDHHRFVFIHVPKTGGDSIDKMLRAHVPDVRKQKMTRHAPYGDILALEPDIADYWSFAMVRNPWARMVSWWSMIDKWNHAWGPASGKPQIKRGGMKDGNKMWRRVAEFADFEEFILRGTDEIPRLAMPQIDYLLAPGRRVDFIGRTESLAADVAHALQEIGLPEAPLPHRNKSLSTGHWRDHYTPVTRDRIARIYAPDCEEWGYTYD